MRLVRSDIWGDVIGERRRALEIDWRTVEPGARFWAYSRLAEAHWQMAEDMHRFAASYVWPFRRWRLLIGRPSVLASDWRITSGSDCDWSPLRLRTGTVF